MTKLTLSPNWELEQSDDSFDRAVFRAISSQNEVRLFGTGGIQIRDGSLELVAKDIKSVGSLDSARVSNTEPGNLVVSDGEGNVFSTKNSEVEVINNFDVLSSSENEVFQSTGDGDIEISNSIYIEVLNTASVVNANENDVITFNPDGSLSFTEEVDVDTLTIKNSKAEFNHFKHYDSGLITDGDGFPLFINKLRDGETISLTEATLVEEPNLPVPAGVDLVLADLTNNQLIKTILQGDGSSTFNHITGDPIDEYTNQTGNEIQVAVVADNGNYNSGSGGSIALISSATIRISR